MFFAAERGRRPRETPHSGGITLNPDMEISVGMPHDSRMPRRRSLETVYPEFSAASVKDIIKIVDPSFTPLEEEFRPTKKLRVIAAPVPAPRGDTDAPPSPETVKPRKKYGNLDQLINDFPHLKDLIEAQEAQMDETRVAVEFTRPAEKSKVEPLLSIQPHSLFSKPTTQSLSATPAADQTSVPPTPSQPLMGLGAETGGGLLAGIDDLFGDRKTTVKSKSRR